MLTDYPVLRDRLYLLYGILGLILGAYASYQGALGHDTADWYQGGIAAYGYVGVGLGFLASSNTDTSNVIDVAFGAKKDPAAAAAEANAGDPAA